MYRREILTASMAASSLSWLTPSRTYATAEGQAIPPITDTNLSLFQWPFRRLPLDDTERLVGKLRSLGVKQAWTSSFEAILHRDIAGVNQRLAAECRQYPELVAIGAINLALPGWQDDFRRCVEEYDMLGVRLFPNYHQYTLTCPEFEQLLERATRAKRIIQLAVTMEDQRTQHPLLQVPDVDLAPLPEILRNYPTTSLQLLNLNPRAATLDRLAEYTGVYFDTARVDGTDGNAKLLERFPKRIMFGTHAPFLIPEAALIRTWEFDLPTESAHHLLYANSAGLRAHLAGAHSS